MDILEESVRLAEFSLAVRESTIMRLSLVPMGFENWRINSEAMSISDIAQHLMDADNWLFKKLETKTLEPMVGRAGLVHVTCRNQYQALLNELEQTGEQRAMMIRRLTQNQLGELIPDQRFRKEVTAWWIIVRGNLDHETHHRGQIVAYLKVLSSRE